MGAALLAVLALVAVLPGDNLITPPAPEGFNGEIAVKFGAANKFLVKISRVLFRITKKTNLHFQLHGFLHV